MKIIRAKDYNDVSRKAANIISAQVIMKPSSVLGLATGDSPLGVYKQLIEWYEKGDLDFSEVKTINLDEYYGLPRNHEQSYWQYMHKNFFDKINIRPQNIFIPDGENTDIQEVCSQYDRIIDAAGGIDLQLLGIGLDGHIGFNEPGASFKLRTHCVELSQSTINANSRFFHSIEEVPKKAYTVGMKSIMQSEKIIMIVSGEKKADIVRSAFHGPISPEVPASILQMHADFTLIGDEAALSML